MGQDPRRSCPILLSNDLPNLVLHDYLVVMKTVRIAELKARLSEHLRSVRRGHSLTILDRDTPIARIVPISDAKEAALTVRSPAPGAPRPGQLRIPPPPRRAKRDIVELLLEDRRSRG